MPNSPAALDTQFDPEDPKSEGPPDDDRADELDETNHRDLFDSPGDSWREVEDLEVLMEIEDEPTGPFLS